MLAIDREVKDAINSAERKNLILSFDDGTSIDNEDIAMESMELEQSISEEDVLRFGKINSACFKVKIKGTTKEYKNLWFNASLNVGEYSLPLGRFFVYSDVATSDRKYREIVAYDTLFITMNRDISEWYNGLTFPISILDMRNSLFEYLGIEQVETELINDSYMVDKTLDGNGISGHKVLQSICELNAVFGVINAYGQFKYVQINNLVDSGLFPSEDLYPSETLYPQDIYDDCLSKADYKLGSITYEEFDTQNITKVHIREEVNDLGVSVGEDGNTYAIEDNFLVYGDTEENLTVVAQNIFDYAKNLTYTPASLKCTGKPWIEVGDMIQVHADDRVFHMPIMNSVLKGIQALTDTYSAQGRETYEEQQEVGFKAEIKQLKSRTNKLTRTIDETRSEITRVETNLEENYPTTLEMSSQIQQTAEEINIEVNKKVGSDELLAKINLSKGTIEIIGSLGISITSPDFQLTTAGEVTASALHALEGCKIATWEIDNNSIFNKLGQSSYGLGLFLSTGTNSPYSIGGSPSISGWMLGAGGKWGVTNAGAMYGNDVHLQGEITATGGEIGGWSVNGNRLYSVLANGDEISLYPNLLQYVDNTAHQTYAVNWKQAIKFLSQNAI